MRLACILLLLPLQMLSGSIAVAQQSLLKRMTKPQSGQIQRDNPAEHQTQLQAYLRNAESSGKIDREYAKSLIALAQTYHGKAQYAAAEPLLKRAIKVGEELEGPESSIVVAGMNDLALLYLAQKKLSEAEPFLKHCLELKEKAIGLGDPDVVTTRENLASLYLAQNRWADAEPLLKLNLQIKETGGKPELIARTRNDAVQVSGIRNQRIPSGPESPEVTATRDNLAAVYRAQGKLAEAEPLMRRNLEVRENTFGPEHPKVCIAVGGLAALYRDQGKLLEAEECFRRSLQIKRKMLAPVNRGIASDLWGLAEVKFSQEHFSEAETFAGEALGIEQQLLMADNPTLARFKRIVARILACQGKNNEAERLMASASETLRRQPRENNSTEASKLSTLANEHYKEGRFYEASRIYDQAAYAFEGTLGPGHPHVALCQTYCAKALRKLGRNTEADVREAEAASITHRTMR